MSVDAGQYQKATDVLRLNEPYSDEDVNRAADAYESTYRVPLVRPGEYDHETGKPNRKFVARLKEFVDAPPEETLTADPAVHRRELRKLMDILKRKGPAKLTDREKAGIHENQKALGLPLMDFDVKMRTPKQIAKDAQERFADAQKSCTTYLDRISFVRIEKDITTLQLFADHDKSEEVREAAFERIQQVQLEGVPEA